MSLAEIKPPNATPRLATKERKWQMTVLEDIAPASRPKPVMQEQTGSVEAAAIPTGHREQAASEAAPALVLDRLCQAYGAVRAVNDISFAIRPGEIVALLGHSGSGKSTLLRLVAGLDLPASGRVLINGQEVTGPNRFVPPEERSVGMMFQDYALFPHLTILENLKFGLASRSRSQADAEAREALTRIGLGARGGDYPHRLSGGEQQRVALARALLPRPKILVMDEPFSNLDRRTRDLIRSETNTILRASHTTAILVTHDPDDAMRMADRIMLMEAGRIVQSGTAEEIYRHPGSLLAAGFFSDFNEVVGVCHGGQVSTILGTFASNGMAEGAAVAVCIRPHDLRIDSAAGKDAPSGRILSRSFVGDSLLLWIAIDGLDRPLQARVPPDATADVGQTVGIDVTAEDVLVFPASKRG
jgi:iron(III) transport system ATP-binding protein